MNDVKEAFTYAEEVLSGKIVAGKLTKLACKRFLEDLKDESFDFNRDKVNHCLRFLNILKHFTDSHAGKNFILEKWQVFIVANLVGFYWKNSDKRRFTESYIEVSRKNGKSALAAALGLYFLIADGVSGAQVIMAANSKGQVKDSGWPLCSGFAKSIDPKGKMLRCYRDSIIFDKQQSSLKVIASDDSKLDGFNASFAILDEYHGAKNSKVKDVIRSSMAMRLNPHLCTITTAGFNKSGPCYALRNVCIEILHGLKFDDTLFASIYELDTDDDWTDKTNWIKCTPNLGVTAREDFMTSETQRAKNNPTDEVGVKTKTFNVWCDSAETWIPSSYIVNNSKAFNIEDLEADFCYVGIDLAKVSDLTAATFLVVKEDKYYFKTHYYLPESALIEKQNKEMYKLWKQQGILHVTPGNTTDYDYVLNDLMKVHRHTPIKGVYYDEYNSSQWAIDCTELGLQLEPFSQGLGSFNGPTKEIERLILSNKVVIDNNEITRFCFDNVCLKYDHNGNCKPVKPNRQDAKKIDGIITMIQALGGYLKTPRYSNEIYVINEETFTF